MRNPIRQAAKAVLWILLGICYLASMTLAGVFLLWLVAKIADAKERPDQIPAVEPSAQFSCKAQETEAMGYLWWHVHVSITGLPKPILYAVRPKEDGAKAIEDCKKAYQEFLKRQKEAKHVLRRP